MKLSVEEEFKDLFKFKDEKHELRHMATMVSFRFLSEVELICEARKINRTELAKMLKTSKSFLTQLFRGDKVLSMQMIVRIEKALSVRFDIKTHKQQIKQ